MQCSFRCIRVLFTCWGAIFRHRDRREKRKVCAGAFSSKNRFICSMDTHRTVVFGIWGYIQVKMCLLHCLHAFHIFSRFFFVLPRRWRRQWTSDENIYPPTHNKTMFQFHSVGAVSIMVFSPFAACIILWKLVSLAASKYGVFYLFFWRAIFLFFSFSFFLPLHHSLVSPPRSIALSLSFYFIVSLFLSHDLFYFLPYSAIPCIVLVSEFREIFRSDTNKKT